MIENEELNISRRAVVCGGAVALVGLVAGARTGAAQTMGFEPGDTEPLTYVTNDGLKITSIEAEPNDVADILGMDLFRFKIELPRPGLRLRTKIEMRHGIEVVETPFVVTSSQPIVGTNVEAKAALYRERKDDGTFRDVLSCWARVGERRGQSGAMREPDGYDIRAISITPAVEKDGSIRLMYYYKNEDAKAEAEAVRAHRKYQEPDKFHVMLTIQVA